MKSVCVFTGSNRGANPAFSDAASELGKQIAAAGARLVYGGGNVGLMGVIADSVLKHGGDVIGVIPHALAEKEVAHQQLTELRLVDSMHTRKAMMAELSDCFVVMPGGFGTLEEMFEVVTWMQIGIHRKPCGMLNVAGYYDSLLEFLDQSVDEGFIGTAHREMILVSDSADKLLKQLSAYVVPTVDKWMDSDQL